MQPNPGFTTRANRYRCQYVWRPDRQALDRIMLDAALDPTADSYFDDMNKAMSALCGIHVRYQFLAGFKWPMQRFARLGTEMAEAAEERAAIPVLRRVNDVLKKRMVFARDRRQDRAAPSRCLF